MLAHAGRRSRHLSSRVQQIPGHRPQMSVCVQGPVEEPESNRPAGGVLSPFFQAFGVEPQDGLRPIPHP